MKNPQDWLEEMLVGIRVELGGTYWLLEEIHSLGSIDFLRREGITRGREVGAGGIAFGEHY